MGYVGEALINFIALLGWHAPDNREIFSIGDLIKEFSLERVQKGGAVFDIKKLDWLNGEYLKNLPTGELYGKLSEFYKEATGILSDKDSDFKLLELGRSRIQKLSDFTALKESFAVGEYDRNLLIWKNRSAGEIRENLTKVLEITRTALAGEFNRKGLESHIMPYAVCRTIRLDGRTPDREACFGLCA